MEALRAKIVLLRANLHCSAIKEAIRKTKGLRLHYERPTRNHKEPEMTHSLSIDRDLVPHIEHSSRTTPSMVLKPVMDQITALLKDRGVDQLEWKWEEHIPELGMYPIAFISWDGAGATLYIKTRR